VRALGKADVDVAVLTLSPDGATEAESMGVPVLRGDYSKQHILSLAHIAQARTFVIADDNPGMTHRVAMVAREMNHDMRIVVRTRRRQEIAHLHEQGVDCVIVDELESVIQLMGQLLKDRDVPSSSIEEMAEAIRGKDYADILDDDTIEASYADDLVVLDPQRQTCEHCNTRMVIRPESTSECRECVEAGDTWVHLRVCMDCGHVACCDSSPNQHMRKHFEATGHPIIRSMEPGEDWGWCYIHEQYIR